MECPECGRPVTHRSTYDEIDGGMDWYECVKCGCFSTCGNCEEVVLQRDGEICRKCGKEID